MLDINIIKQRYDMAKDNYNIRLGEFNSLKRSIDDYTNKIANHNVLLKEKIQISELLNATSKEARKIAITKLETIVSKAIQYISESNYSFEIQLGEERGKPSCEFFVTCKVNGEISKQKPEDACGGGFVDIISTALRYAYTSVFSNPVINNNMILDEPGKMIDEVASDKFAEFLKELGNTFNKPSIIITHNSSIASIADNAYTVTKNGDKSIINQSI